MNSADIFLAVFSGVVGVIVTHLAQHITLLCENARQHDIFGQWFSEYQTIYGEEGTWVPERITFELKFGKIILTNTNNPKGYIYSGTCRRLEENHLIGEWKSTKSGAHANGVFMLTKTPQGDVMYGYWSGPTKTGTIQYGRWVLAKQKTSIAIGKSLIARCSLQEKS